MGVDIYMDIIDKNGNFIKKDIYDGRNSEWFNNLMQRGWDDEYDTLPILYSDEIPKNAPKEVLQKDNEYGFGYTFLLVKDFKEWFEKKRPDIDAGWLSTYDKWKYEHKGIYPENLSHYLMDDVNLNDYHFIEVINPYDGSAWLYNYLKDNNINDDNYITYHFS